MVHKAKETEGLTCKGSGAVEGWALAVADVRHPGAPTDIQQRSEIVDSRA
jgi:hypothetical protein